MAKLRTELFDERKRRRSIERQLATRNAQLSALHEEIADLRATIEETPPHTMKRIELPRDRGQEGFSYWLRRCEGFEVEANGRPIGIVESIRFGRHYDRPDALLIVTPGWRQKLLVARVETIAAISYHDGQITLATDPRGNQPKQRTTSLTRIFARVPGSLGTHRVEREP